MKPLIGSAATETRIKAEISRARYLHFSTHGLLNDASPMYSAIAFTKSDVDDGRLYARELLDLRLNADLVVLSACDTALGQETQGEGVIGLVWALFVAGAPSSVATQWTVQDAGAKELMGEFYHALKASSGRIGMSKAEALRTAQQKMLRDPKYRHPYYWAPFILTGSWR